MRLLIIPVAHITGGLRMNKNKWKIRENADREHSEVLRFSSCMRTSVCVCVCMCIYVSMNLCQNLSESFICSLHMKLGGNYNRDQNNTPSKSSSSFCGDSIMPSNNIMWFTWSSFITISSLVLIVNVILDIVHNFYLVFWDRISLCSLTETRFK